MKTLIQKLPLSTDTSFVARTYRTPNFEVPWHRHSEYELIWFTQGEGLSFVGNHVGDFVTGDVFFLGKNLPHTFQKNDSDLITSAIVVQFNENFWGNSFLEMPESQNIVELFDASSKGLKIRGESRNLLAPVIRDMEHAKGFDRLVGLCKCLNVLAKKKEYTTLSTQHAVMTSNKKIARIEKVFQYTIANYDGKITLDIIADIAGMTPPAFCNFFKQSTKKTFITFLNEVRIGAACKKLITTDDSILQICYDTGFNTLANFNSRFLKIKNMPPSVYRKTFKKSRFG